MSMAPHQQRVVDEARELNDKLDKLNAFFGNPVFASLNADEQERMKRQAAAMTDYSRVLAERISAF